MNTKRSIRLFGSLLCLSLAALACAGPESTPELDGAPPTAAAPETAAGALVARSIAFHDPGGIWGTRPIEVDWAGTNGEGEERVAVQFSLGADQADFRLTGRYAGSTLEYETSADTWSAVVDGETELSDETREEMRLHREMGSFGAGTTASWRGFR